MKPETTVIVDRRPLWLLLFLRGHRYFLLAGLAGLGLWLGSMQPPVGLSLPGWHALILFIVCVVLWVFQVIPLAITGLLAIAAQPLLGIASYQEAYATFGHPTVFFLLGVFILAAAFMRTGLSTRLAIALLRGAGRNPRHLVFRIMLSSAVLSCLMSEHAVAAMMFPIVLEFARALTFIPHGGSYGRLLFLAMAWGCVVGGITTLLGGGRAPLAIGFLEEFSEQSLGFLEWTALILPVAFVMFGVAYYLLLKFFPVDVESVEVVDQALQKKKEGLGKVRFSEQVISVVFLVAIIGWMAFGRQVGMASVAILAVIALFVFNVVRWVDLEKYVNWGIILLYGGAIGLGTALHRTGAGDWLVQHYILPSVTTPWALVVVLAVVSVVMTEAISNSAVVAVLMPIALSLAPQYGIDPRGLVLLIGAGSGLAYALPMSTPAVAIAFSSGYYRLREIALPALLLHLISLGCMLAAAKWWWPLFGIEVF